jgi:hypothetical protein
LGIVLSPCRRRSARPGRENHRHVAALQLRLGFDLADVGEARGHPVEHGLAELEMRDLPAAVHHGDLDLVALAQELAGVPGLELEVMVVDAGPVLHFLQLNDVLLLLRRPRRLRLFELEFPVVHDLDDGRAGSRSHFHEVQPAILGGGQRLLNGQNAELLTFGADDPHRTDANHAIDAGSLFALVRGQWSCLRRQ